MADIILRGIKGSPLSIDELDTNFININNDIGTKLPLASYTAADVFAKVLSLDGQGSGLDADTLDSYNASISVTANTIAVRNSSGNILATSFIGDLTGNVTATTISSNNITASGTISGNLSGNLVGSLQGPVTGNLNGKVGAVTPNTGEFTDITITGTLTANSSVGSTGQVLASRGAGQSPQWVTVDASNTDNVWTGAQTFKDNKFSVVDDADSTKILNLQLSSITTGNTRTLTIPDANGTIATREWTGAKTISSSTPSGGSSGDVWYQV